MPPLPKTMLQAAEVRPRLRPPRSSVWEPIVAKAIVRARAPRMTVRDRMLAKARASSRLRAPKNALKKAAHPRLASASCPRSLDCGRALPFRALPLLRQRDWQLAGTCDPAGGAGEFMRVSLRSGLFLVAISLGFG